MEGLSGAAVLDALAKECYEAGMAAELVTSSIMDCSAVVERRSLGGDSSDADQTYAVITSHKLRFTLTPRGEAVHVRADAWLETQELGTVIEQPIASGEYLGRVRDVVRDVGERLRSADAAEPAWAGRYESEQQWHLDAHLRAVSYCDRRLADFSAEALGRELEAVGQKPLSAGTRDRCEQLYQQLFEWGLARGIDEPTVEGYAEYRATLPPEERACSGRLALESVCS